MSGNILNANFGDDDDESENDFNPAAQEPSDDEAEVSAPRNNNRPSNGGNSDLDDDDQEDNGEDDEGEGEDLGDGDGDDDEDEEDEDEDDAIGGRPRKRRRRRINQFIEEEAEVDEDDDEIEADEDDIAETGFIQEQADDDAEAEADTDDRRHRELDRQRQVEASLDAESAAQRFKERYGRRTTQGMAKSSFVPQNLLMPSVDDPSIWGIGCKPGKERETVMALMKKVQQRIAAGRPLKIMSVFERGGPQAPMAGYVWIEARRQADVLEACDKVANCYLSKVHLVPVKEMPDLLRVKKSKPLELGGYVRIKRGLYAGDLGMVQEFEDNGTDALIRLVPRLDYGLNEDDNKPANAEKRKRTPFAPSSTPLNRPPPRLFNENEAKKRHSRFLIPNRALTGNSWTYKGEEYEDGFLFKRFRVNVIQSEDVNPRLDEISRLAKTTADGSSALDLETLAHSLKNSAAAGTYVPGDDVEVFQGEQKGILGKVEGISGSILRIKISSGELEGQIVEQPIQGVRKRFNEGDHVKVIGGKFTGEVGMIIKIKDDRVTVLTDTSTQEITVFSRDLREAAEAGGSEIKSSGYDVQDLVQLSATQVGIVIKSDLEAVRILDENSSVVTRLPSQLQKVEEKKNMAATDRNGSEIRVGDRIKEAGGENKEGQILHIHRGHVFVHDRTRIENAGLWTTRCMNVITIASKANATQSSGPDLSKMNPNLKGLNGAQPMAPPPRVGRDRLIGQLIHIRKGPYKGHKGLVKDTTVDTARVELQSKNKVINIPKPDLSVIDKATNKPVDYHTFASSRGGAFPMRTGGAPSSRVPDSGFSGGRTPALGDSGGRTPAWGASSARTPAWNGGGGYDSGKTPAWKPSSGAATSYGGAGNMTSYGGPGNYGSRGGATPAWNSSARTPFSGDSGFGGSGGSGYDAFAAGSRTPFGASASSRTPAWNDLSNGPMSAPTPAARGFDAPTPAVSAPTPGGYGNSGGYTAYGGGAPTPGAGFGPVDAPTPGFAKGSNREELKFNRMTAPTPGGYDAPTPAAGGPRYAEDDDD